MYTEIIIFMFFCILCNTLAVISIMLCKTSRPKVIPDYAAADNFINGYTDKDGCSYNLTVYREYLAYHFAKYEHGILPKQSMTLICRSLDVDYTISFYDCLNENTVKYLKQAMKLLKEPKPKRQGILKQANQVIRASTRTATIS